MGGLITVGSFSLQSYSVASLPNNFVGLQKGWRLGVWEFSYHQAPKGAWELYLYSRTFQKPTGVLEPLQQVLQWHSLGGLALLCQGERERILYGWGRRLFVSCCIPWLSGFSCFSGMALKRWAETHKYKLWLWCALRTQKGQRPLSLSVRFLCCLHPRGTCYRCTCLITPKGLSQWSYLHPPCPSLFLCLACTLGFFPPGSCAPDCPLPSPEQHRLLFLCPPHLCCSFLNSLFLILPPLYSWFLCVCQVLLSPRRTNRPNKLCQVFAVLLTNLVFLLLLVLLRVQAGSPAPPPTQWAHRELSQFILRNQLMYSTRQKHPSPGRISRIRMCSKLSWGLHNLITSSRAPGRGELCSQHSESHFPWNMVQVSWLTSSQVSCFLRSFHQHHKKKRKATEKGKSWQPWKCLTVLFVCSELGWEGSSAQQAVYGEPLTAQEVVKILFGSLRQLGCSWALSVTWLVSIISFGNTSSYIYKLNAPVIILLCLAICSCIIWVWNGEKG